MWGNEPFSQREGHQQELMEIIRPSEENPQNDSHRFRIAEINAPPAEGTTETIPVGVAVVCDALPSYLLERPEFKGEIEKARPLLFIEFLITDHRAHRRQRGARVVLVEAIKRRALLLGKSNMYLDAWVGNGQKLNW
jgi:hypothetical protein